MDGDGVGAPDGIPDGAGDSVGVVLGWIVGVAVGTRDADGIALGGADGLAHPQNPLKGGMGPVILTSKSSHPGMIVSFM